MRITQRLHFIKITVLVGLLISVLLSINLWAGQRWFPKATLLNQDMQLNAPYDYTYLSLLIVLTILSILNSKKVFILCLIIFSTYLCLDDQNRLQPWFFNYNLILLILLFYKNRVDDPNNYTTIFISLQLLVALIYIFSGIQKLNPLFVSDTFQWMISPLDTILSKRQLTLLLKFGYAVPYIELSLGILLLVKPMRFIAVPLIISMHIILLILLGPFGKNYNSVVWPWNIIMIVLVLLLFSNVKQERFFDISFLFKNMSFYLVIILMLLLPFLSLFNKYDSYLSSSLYSSNVNNCQLILSNKTYQNLPLYIRHFTVNKENKQLLYIKKWAMHELNTPCVPEYRIFKTVQAYIIKITNTDTNHVSLRYTEKRQLLHF